MTRPDPHPAQLGFSMPPEWTPHAATWTSWPFRRRALGRAARGRSERVHRTGSNHRPFRAGRAQRQGRRCRNRRQSEVGKSRRTFRDHHLPPRPLNDVWFRDNGPIFVVNPAGQVALTDWGFNAWGEKYRPWHDDDHAPVAVARTLNMKRFEVPIIMEGGSLELNARGVCLTTRSCLLSQQRNPNLSETDLEEILRATLGVKHLVWLERRTRGRPHGRSHRHHRAVYGRPDHRLLGGRRRDGREF